MIRNSPFSFGYVELIYAESNKMLFGVVKNSSGNWVKASTDRVSSAAAGAAKNMPADYRVSITNAPGADAYPISSFTWLLIPDPSKDPAKGKVLHDFLQWMVDHGEAEASSMTYAPLPACRHQDGPQDHRGRSLKPRQGEAAHRADSPLFSEPSIVSATRGRPDPIHGLFMFLS